jgi:hypothetical protein
MLEQQRYLIKRMSRSQGQGRAFEILDPDTERCAGFARENPSAIVRRLRQFLSLRFLPTRIEAREIEDESLVFIVNRSAGLVSQEIEVADADEQLIGYLRLSAWATNGNVRIHDSNCSLFAELQGNWETMNIVMLGPDGAKLGSVTKASPNESLSARTPGSFLLVAIDECLTDQPFAKMLLLGSTLGLAFVYR